MSKGWDNATLKKLKALMVKGLSTSEIGKRLGMSKNAVVGKLNRLGWNLKAGGVTGADLPKKDSTKKAVKTTSANKKGVSSAKSSVKKTVSSTSKKSTSAKTTKKSEVKKSDTKASKGTSKSLNKNLAIHQRIIQHSLEMANLKPNQCRWPIGDPDSENFHFCGAQVFVGKPYCYEHCKQAYQFTPLKKK